MAWTNIFDLGEWDVYVEFWDDQVHAPDTNNHFVKMEDFPTSAGSITVVGGVIVCDFAFAATGIPSPAVIVVPKGTPPAAAQARVSIVTNLGGPLAPLVTSIDQECRVQSVVGMAVAGQPDEFNANYGTVANDNILSGTAISNFAFPDAIPSGQGMEVWMRAPGGG